MSVVSLGHIVTLIFRAIGWAVFLLAAAILKEVFTMNRKQFLEYVDHFNNRRFDKVASQLPPA